MAESQQDDVMRMTVVFDEAELEQQAQAAQEKINEKLAQAAKKQAPPAQARQAPTASGDATSTAAEDPLVQMVRRVMERTFGPQGGGRIWSNLAQRLSEVVGHIAPKFKLPSAIAQNPAAAIGGKIPIPGAGADAAATPGASRFWASLSQGFSQKLSNLVSGFLPRAGSTPVRLPGPPPRRRRERPGRLPRAWQPGRPAQPAGPREALARPLEPPEALLWGP